MTLDKTRIIVNLQRMLTSAAALSAHLSEGARQRARSFLRQPQPGELCVIGFCRASTDPAIAFGRYLGCVDRSGNPEYYIVLETGLVHSWTNCTIAWVPETAAQLSAAFGF